MSVSKICWANLCILNVFNFTRDSLFFIFIIASQQATILIRNKQSTHCWVSLVAQWLGIRLSMPGTRIRTLGREDPTCCGATKPKHHNYWARALEPASHNYWSLQATTKTQCSQKYIKNFWASLVAQWLRICLPMQGTRVRALVWEDPTYHGATRPVSHNYWACASGACAPQQERPW